MFVYRVCDKKEIDTILKEKSLDNIGSICTIDKKKNTHDYKEGVKYLHFYHDYGDVFYSDSKDRNYICTYDIPIEILKPREGVGYYLDRELFRTWEKVPEYAVEVDLLSFHDLKKVERLNDLIFFDEYINNDYHDKIETVYKKQSKVLKKTLRK